jgi:hypothetical protein
MSTLPAPTKYRVLTTKYRVWGIMSARRMNNTQVYDEGDDVGGHARKTGVGVPGNENTRRDKPTTGS